MAFLFSTCISWFFMLTASVCAAWTSHGLGRRGIPHLWFGEHAPQEGFWQSQAQQCVTHGQQKRCSHCEHVTLVPCSPHPGHRIRLLASNSVMEESPLNGQSTGEAAWCAKAFSAKVHISESTPSGMARIGASAPRRTRTTRCSARTRGRGTGCRR